MPNVCFIIRTEYFCSIRISFSFPSHRLVQFSFAQQRQKGISGRTSADQFIDGALQ